MSRNFQIDYWSTSTIGPKDGYILILIDNECVCTYFKLTNWKNFSFKNAIGVVWIVNDGYSATSRYGDVLVFHRNLEEVVKLFKIKFDEFQKHIYLFNNNEYYKLESLLQAHDYYYSYIDNTDEYVYHSNNHTEISNLIRKVPNSQELVNKYVPQDLRRFYGQST